MRRITGPVALVVALALGGCRREAAPAAAPPQPPAPRGASAAKSAPAQAETIAPAEPGTAPLDAEAFSGTPVASGPAPVLGGGDMCGLDEDDAVIAGTAIHGAVGTIRLDTGTRGTHEPAHRVEAADQLIPADASGRAAGPTLRRRSTP